MSNAELQEAISKDMGEFNELLKADAEIKCEVSDADDSEKKVVSISFDGQELGYMIGNHGRHLSALQFILSMMINKKYTEEQGDRMYVNIDVSGYKQERESKVTDMALRMADDARILGEPVDLDPMPASERRLVHVALQQFDDIKTESFGEGRDRAIRIIPESEADLGVSSFDEDSSNENEEEESE